MFILGISAYYHDSSACIIEDGKIIAAAQEERFSRKKNDSTFPTDSINYCLKEAKIELKDCEYIVFYDKPFLKFERILETYFAFAPHGFKSFCTSMPLWVRDKLFQKRLIIKELGAMGGTAVNWGSRLLFSEHHLSHAASAFYPSPFESSAILTLDGVGEWVTTSIAVGCDNHLSIKKEIHFPHSLGLLYSAFTSYLGFKVNSGEYKMMGLAPYGSPKYVDLIKTHLIDIKEDGSFALDMSYFQYATGLRMTNKKFHNLFGAAPRPPESEIDQTHMDLAASIQIVTEEVILKLAKNIAKITGEKNLCLAGGVALNCVANGKLVESGIFEKIWIQPAAGDAGGSIGAALGVYYLMLNNQRLIQSGHDGMQGSYLGPAYTQNQVFQSLNKLNANFSKLSKEEIINKAAIDLASGKAVGWMNGRMEFGPRSLGGRSILADPRSPEMQKVLNLKVKYRESFRPFAPSVLREDLQEWFELNVDSPYMLLVANIATNKRTNMEGGIIFSGIEKVNQVRSIVPAVTHIDYSARIQTVHKETNADFYALITRFKELTGCPILVNTSFNIRGEPMVCSPEDAYKCFMGTDLDSLVIEDFYLEKSKQLDSQCSDYKNSYELD